MEYTVDIRDVAKYRGATAAVDGCSLSIKRHEFFSLLGPSGSGKTTLLRLLAGFERPDRGDILIDGRSMGDVPPNRRPVNLVFQHYALFPHLTVFQNVAFGLEMRRVSRGEIASRVAAMLEIVKLADKAMRWPSQLSGGEQQRVALARALVNQPAVVLLDEPLGALDRQLRRAMQLELKAIQEQVGLTFLYVTHDQEEALTMSDRIAVMKDGRIVQIGSPHDVYESPRSSFIARFLGVSNQLTGRVEACEGLTCRIRVLDSLALAARCLQPLAPGTTAVLTIRPERLRLSRERPSQPGNQLPGRIARAVYNGSELQYHIALGETASWLVPVSIAGSDHKPFVPGEAMYLHWNPSDGVALTE